MFLRLGYERTSMDAVAAEAGVSKRTVYDRFDSKEALFRQICEAVIDRILGEADFRPAAGADPETALLALARRYLDGAVGREAVGLYRVVVHEAPRLRDLGRLFWEASLGRATASLAEYLAAQTRRGVLAVEDPVRCAEQFFVLVGAAPNARALLGIAPTPSRKELEAQACLAVQTFLRGVEPRGKR